MQSFFFHGFLFFLHGFPFCSGFNTSFQGFLGIILEGISVNLDVFYYIDVMFQSDISETSTWL